MNNPVKIYVSPRSSAEKERRFILKGNGQARCQFKNSEDQWVNSVPTHTEILYACDQIKDKLEELIDYAD